MPTHPTNYPRFSSRDIIGLMVNNYEDASQRLQPTIDALCFLVNSDKAEEEYSWLGAAPVMREFVGGRKRVQIPDYDFKIKNRIFETTLPIKIDDLRRDKTGVIQNLINQVPVAAAQNPLILLTELIENGSSSLCYDGQYFFDTDHGENGTSQSNSITTDISALPCANHGDTTTPSVEEYIQAIIKSIVTMGGFKNDQGQPVNRFAEGFLIYVPNNHAPIAQQAVGLSNIDYGKTNPLRRYTIEVVPDPMLSASDTFYTFRTDSMAQGKPFVHQVEVDTMFDALGTESEHAKKEREVLAMAEKIESMGYGKWNLAVKNQLT